MISKNDYIRSIRKLEKRHAIKIRNSVSNDITKLSGKEKLAFYSCFDVELEGFSNYKDHIANLLFVTKLAFKMDNPVSNTTIVSEIKRLYRDKKTTDSVKKLIEDTVDRKRNDDILKKDIQRLVNICGCKNFDTYELYKDLETWSFARNKWIDALVA